MTAPTIASAWAEPRNNFNAMRLVAAWLVIYGHAWAITGSSGQDMLASLTAFRFAGAIAVDMFFVLSGFLIAASLQRHNVRGYLISRGLRILPALVVCVGVTTFILGPLLSTSANYWAQATTWHYFLINATLVVSRFQLPGVFTAHPLDVVNGSLWTLPIEAKLYLLLLIAWMLGLLAPKRYTPLWALTIVIGCTLAWRTSPLPDHLHHRQLAVDQSRTYSALGLDRAGITGLVRAVTRQSVGTPALLRPAHIRHLVCRAAGQVANDPPHRFFLWAISVWLARAAVGVDAAHGKHRRGEHTPSNRNRACLRRTVMVFGGTPGIAPEEALGCARAPSIAGCSAVLKPFSKVPRVPEACT
jgi:peptidoglycan/LPS O-acetylase OafA/YrhL